jgi:hypothetical protein
MLIKYLDFHFRKQNESFQLDVYTRDSSQPLATAGFTLPRSFLNGTELKQLDFDTRDPVGRVERLREFGSRLYQKIFTPEVERVWSEHTQNNEFSVLCIRIMSDANELEAVAWEAIFDGEEFIAAGTKTTISRLPLDIHLQAAPPAVPLPLKMLEDSVPSVRTAAGELIKALGMLQTVYLGILGFAKFIPETMEVYNKALFIVPIVPWVIAAYYCLRVMKTEIVKINLRSPSDIREKAGELLEEKQRYLEIAFVLLLAGIVFAFVMVVFRVRM